MRLVDKIKDSCRRVSRKVTIKDLADRVRVSVCGRKNEPVKVRVLEPSGKPKVFFDDGLTTELNFTIPQERDFLEIDCEKPGEGDYTLEITTPTGATLVKFLRNYPSD